MKVAFFHPPQAKSDLLKRWMRVGQKLVDCVLDSPAARRTSLDWFLAHLDQQASEVKKVLVTGVFDLLHAEHRQFLQLARAQGDVLLVGVESDQRVTQMKGAGRPIQPLAERILALRSLGFIDCVFALPEKFNQPEYHESLISKIQPSILAVSSHTAHLAAKQKVLQKYGGKVIVVHQYNPHLSTTQLIRQAQKE